jgi:hypothetical protein
MGNKCIKPVLTRKKANEENNIDFSNVSLKKIALKNMSNDTSVYHNQQHIRDVVNFTREAICEVSLSVPNIAYGMWRDVLISAAYLHDICHPAGDSIMTIKEVAASVTGRLPELDATLEHLHSEIGVALLSKTTSFRSYSPKCKEDRIRLITDLIMQTNIGTYKTPCSLKDTRDIAIVILRCADLSHFTFPIASHLKRVGALNNELDASMTPQQNADFIEKFVLPQFEALASICQSPQAEEWLHNVKFKYRYWSELAKDKKMENIITSQHV